MCEWVGSRRKPRGQKDRGNEVKGEGDVHSLRAASSASASLPSGKESNWLEVLGKPPMSKGGPGLPGVSTGPPPAPAGSCVGKVYSSRCKEKLARS